MIKILKKEFPELRKHDNYANLLLIGARLKAFDRDSSKRRSVFVKNGVKEHTLTCSYTKLNLIITIRDADKNIVVASDRFGVLFTYVKQQEAVCFEQEQLFAHIKQDSHVRSIVCNFLKLGNSCTVNLIIQKMRIGDIFHQVEMYKKIFIELSRNGALPKDCSALGIKTVPVSHYYLSKQAQNIIDSAARL